MDVKNEKNEIAEVFVRVLFLFEPTVDEELELKVGDVLKVVREVDDFWYLGQNLVNGSTGQFPKDFVSVIELPVLNHQERLYFALDTFYAEVKDDLPFEKGDIIVLVRKVDESWGYGRCNNKNGIFPLNYTQRIFTGQLQPQVPVDFDKSTVICKVKATMPLTAQIDGELSFIIGDVISVTEIMPDNWARGQLGNSSGIFPLTFTTHLNESNGTGLENKPALVSSTKHHGWKKSFVSSTQRNGSRFHTSSQLPLDNNHAGYSAPLTPLQSSSTISVTPKCSSSPKHINEHQNSAGSGVDKAIDKPLYSVTASYSYQRRNCDELSFAKGDVINIIEEKSDMWLYGKLRDAQGYIPVNYVSKNFQSQPGAEKDSEMLLEKLKTVIGEDKNFSSDRNEHAKRALVSILKNQVDVRLVISDFKASSDFEISLQIGATVHVLQQINDEWCEVKNNRGSIGFVPNACLQRVTSSVPKQSKTYEGHMKELPGLTSEVMADHENQVTVNSAKVSGEHLSAHETSIQLNSIYELPSHNGLERTVSAGEMPNKTQVSAQKIKPSKKGMVRSESMQESCYAVRNKTIRQLPDAAIKGNSPKTVHQEVNKNVPRSTSDTKLHASTINLKYPESDTLSTASHDSAHSTSVSSCSSNTESHSNENRHHKSKCRSSDAVIWFGTKEHKQSDSDDFSPRSSGRRLNRSAPPPPRHQQTNSSPSHRTEVNKIPSAPVRPPQPSVKLKANQKTSDVDKKQLSEENKLKIEKIRSEIEEYCRVRKDLEHVYNNTFDGKERQEISENRQFVAAKLRRLQAELQNLISNADQTTDSEVLEEISSNDSGVAVCVTPLPAPSLPPTPDMKEKRLSKKNHVIRELVKTEEDFLQDVCVTIDDIMIPLLERELPLDINVETLFGNIEEIRNFSKGFLASLKEACNASTNDTSEKELNVGQSFIDHIVSMKEVYKMYCRNHDDATALLEKYEEDPEFQIPVVECLNNVKNKVNTFDLGSFLIKPVQRILKYPLLLQELLKLTEIPRPDNPNEAYDQLLQAVKLMQEVANDINEDKRRKDLVRKYRKGSQETATLSGKIARLSLHSVKKKSARISRRLGHVTGLNQPDTVDETFNAIELRFKNLERALKIFLQNSDSYANQYRDQLNMEHVIIEHFSDIAGSDMTTTIASYNTAMRRIAEHFYRQFHDQTMLRVHSPLSSLLTRFKGPQAIMDKRYDKLLDYENCQKNSDSKEKIQMAKNVYEALNQQLLDELPKICQLGCHLLETCIALFVRLQIRFQRKMFEELKPTYEVCKKEVFGDGKKIDKTKVMEHFNKEHNQALVKMEDLTIIPSSFCAMASLTQPQVLRESIRRPRPKVVAMQTSERQQELLNKYKTEDLCVAISNHSSQDKVEISCSSDDLIAVVKRQDPLGNINKWFCDNGAAKGFLPSRILKPYTPLSRTPSPQPPAENKSPYKSLDSSEYFKSPGSELAASSSHPYSEHKADENNRKQSEFDDSVNTEGISPRFVEEDGTLGATDYVEPESEEKEYFRVEFNFIARSTLELNVEEGDIVTLITPHDLQGNTEWWLMADLTGGQGYVPANYMSRAEYI